MGDDATLLRDYVIKKKNECLGSIGDVVLEKSGKFCEMFFDGFLCWKYTEAGSVAIQSCPDDDFIYSSIKVSYTNRNNFFYQ